MKAGFVADCSSAVLKTLQKTEIKMWGMIEGRFEWGNGVIVTTQIQLTAYL